MFWDYFIANCCCCYYCMSISLRASVLSEMVARYLRKKWVFRFHFSLLLLWLSLLLSLSSLSLCRCRFFFMSFWMATILSDNVRRFCRSLSRSLARSIIRSFVRLFSVFFFHTFFVRLSLDSMHRQAYIVQLCATVNVVKNIFTKCESFGMQRSRARATERQRNRESGSEGGRKRDEIEYQSNHKIKIDE